MNDFKDNGLGCLDISISKDDKSYLVTGTIDCKNLKIVRRFHTFEEMGDTIEEVKKELGVSFS